MNTRLMLEVLKKSITTTDILLNIFIGGGFNYKKLKRKILCPTILEFSQTDNKNFILEKKKNNFYSLLSRLRKQGLVKKNRKMNKTHWAITSFGEKRLKKIQNTFRCPKLNYESEKDNNINIIVFDIPEKYKFKREWLRRGLLMLGFTLLQKSVFMGKNKLPENFLKDLSELDLMDYIHIFRITKTGTIKKIGS